MYLCIFTILPCVWISLNLLNFFYFDPVTGDANFHIDSTSLTVGGFNQPSIARTLIEIPCNAEKGLSQGCFQSQFAQNLQSLNQLMKASIRTSVCI